MAKWGKAIKVHLCRKTTLQLGESLIVPKDSLKPWVSDALNDGKEVKICASGYTVSR